MKLYAPHYYQSFRCIADACEHSCCIGWEIDIDGETLEKYTTLKNGYRVAITESISMEDTPHFRLLAHDRCPHLDERGLCRIIANVGEDYLCDICREHPRFYNYTDVAEVGLGISCREAARIVLSSQNYDVFEEVGEISAEECIVEYDARSERSKVYAILRDKKLDYKSKIKKIQYNSTVRKFIK
jgi:lysine-N-methylase